MDNLRRYSTVKSKGHSKERSTVSPTRDSTVKSTGHLRGRSMEYLSQYSVSLMGLPKGRSMDNLTQYSMANSMGRWRGHSKVQSMENRIDPL